MMGILTMGKFNEDRIYNICEAHIYNVCGKAVQKIKLVSADFAQKLNPIYSRIKIQF